MTDIYEREAIFSSAQNLWEMLEILREIRDDVKRIADNGAPKKPSFEQEEIQDLPY
jgi:hypothetical protein